MGSGLTCPAKAEDEAVKIQSPRAQAVSSATTQRKLAILWGCPPPSTPWIVGTDSHEPAKKNSNTLLANVCMAMPMYDGPRRSLQPDAMIASMLRATTTSVGISATE